MSVFINLPYTSQIQDIKKKQCDPFHYWLHFSPCYFSHYPARKRRGSTVVLFPFTKCLLTNCEAFESDSSPRDTSAAASNGPRVNKSDVFSREKGIPESSVTLSFPSFLSIKFSFEGHRNNFKGY
jgi:hypothetical protein